MISTALKNKPVRTLLAGISFTLGFLSCSHANDLSQRPLTEILKSEYVGEVPVESSQYDFFIGEWDVLVTEYSKEGEVKDTAKGVWWAKYIHDKRVLLDDIVIFDGKGKLYPGYPSLRTYSPKLGKWMSMHMAPLATQASCRNIGTWKNNEMHIDSTCQQTKGEKYSRVRFYNITENSFDYTWEDSTDKENWILYVTFEGQRRK